jgi:hypothetical protein
MPNQPKIFISHRFADQAIADVIANNLRRWGCDDIFQAGAPGSGPQPGGSLPNELKEALHASKLVILVYTLADEDWSWCLWECGLATHPIKFDTRTVVFLCGKNSQPKPLVDLVMVKADAASIRDFTTHFHRKEDFFPGEPALRPAISDQTLDDLSRTFYQELAQVLPLGEREERYRWDCFTLTLQRSLAETLKNETNETSLLDSLQDTLLVADDPLPFGDALRHFGYANFEPNLRLRDLVERWTYETQSRARPADWIIGLSREIVRAIRNQPAKPEWQQLNSVVFPDLSLYPVLNHMRVLPDGSMEFDIYLYNVLQQQQRGQ